MPVKVWQPGQKRETKEEKDFRLNVNAQRMALPYDSKVLMAKHRIREWADMCYDSGKNYAVSVGGLDSITLLKLCRETLREDVPGISASVLEDKRIQAVHKEMGVIPAFEKQGADSTGVRFSRRFQAGRREDQPPTDSGR
jgi:hypothetical protein